jgi:hypothetical protein
MFNNDEINLMCIYNTGTREGLIAELEQMRELPRRGGNRASGSDGFRAGKAPGHE